MEELNPSQEEYFQNSVVKVELSFLSCSVVGVKFSSFTKLPNLNLPLFIKVSHSGAFPPMAKLQITKATKSDSWLTNVSIYIQAS